MSIVEITRTIAHQYAGAEWIKHSLEAVRRRVDGSRSRNKPKISRHLSPLGRAVADVLGLVFRGIYHMDTNALLRADWENTWGVEVDLHNHHELASFDGSELTLLMVASNDMGMRVAVSAVFGGRLRLSFHPRVFQKDELDRACKYMQRIVASHDVRLFSLRLAALEPPCDLAARSP